MSDDQQRRSAPLFNRLVGSVVSPVVDSVDIDHIVERIDVNDVVARVDLDAVIAGLDLNEILDRIDADRLLDRVDPDRLLDRLDVDRLLGRVDINALVQRVDLNAVMNGVDLDRLLGQLDMNALVNRVDLDTVIQRVDVDALIQRVDINTLVQRVDLDAVVRRIDLDTVLDGLDLDRLVGRVDLDAVVDGVDLNRALEGVDVNAVVERTELGSIIARSTTGVFGELLDVARTQLMGVDQIVQGVPARLLRNARSEIPAAPGGAPAAEDLTSDDSMAPSERATAFQGRYAGSVTRFLAFIVDQFVIGALFGLGALLMSAAFTVVIGADLTLSEDRLLIVIAYCFWAFVYLAGSLAATGRTVGKAIIGVLVVDTAGQQVRGKAAVVRTLAFPISFLAFGLGLLLGLVRRDRRELHDLVAGTAVVYDWDAAIAQRRVRPI